MPDTHHATAHRRRFLGIAASASLCAASAQAEDSIKDGYRWKMALSWQKNLPGMGTGAVRLAKRIGTLSQGELTVEVYSGGELAPALGVFDAVSSGAVEMGHSAAYYWTAKNPASAFFCGVPGGMVTEEMNAWLYYGGGMKLWHELYAPFGLIAFPAGSTGVQSGGWFNREINSLDDIKGLKMRIPGQGGEIITKLGGSSVVIAGHELYTAMQSGVIDATEWVGPWNDVSMGLHKIAKHYYAPGLHEPGSTLECLINRNAYLALPKHLQQIIKSACAVENIIMHAEYTARNTEFLQILKNDHNITPKPFPKDVTQAFFHESSAVIQEIANNGAIEKKIVDSYTAFLSKSTYYQPHSTYGYLKARANT